MLPVPISPPFDSRSKVRNLLFILLSVVLFLFKGRYSGPLDEIVHAYAGNFLISFAVYFNFMNLEYPQRFRRVLAAAGALAVVELFEAFDGFGIMSNTYDPIDFLANAVGIAMAFLIDSKLGGRRGTNVKIPAPSPR